MVTRRTSTSQPTAAAPAPAPAGAAASAGPAAGGAMPALPEGAVDVNEAFGTKTLAELREEAAKERRDLLVSLMPARSALLAEIFYLFKGRAALEAFGAGADPAGNDAHADLAKNLVPDPSVDGEVTAFIEEWIQDPRLAPHFKLELPPMKPTPPPSPIRRDSQLHDVSEEVAAVENELIRPEYRRHAPQASTSTSSAAAPASADAHSMQVDGDGQTVADVEAAPQGDTGELTDPTDPAASSGHVKRPSISTNGIARHRRQSSLASPYPVTFRSPSFRTDLQTTPFLTQISESPLQQPLTIAPSQLTLDPPPSNEAFVPSHPPHPQPDADDASHIPYANSLLPLPDYIVKGRSTIGGLAKRKARDRQAQQQAAQAAATSHPSTSSTPQAAAAAAAAAAANAANLGPLNSDLYKLGVSKATHMGVRSLMGAGAPAPGKARTGSKALLTSDWRVAISELQSLKALERIEQLKADKSWSFRQLRKQRAPGINKSHWDYLLEEMRWLATDVRQETRWKIATAHQIALDVREWHGADEELKKELQVRTRARPALGNMEGDSELILETPDVSMAVDEEPAQASAGKSVNGNSRGASGKDASSSTALPTTNDTATTTSADAAPSGVPPPAAGRPPGKEEHSTLPSSTASTNAPLPALATIPPIMPEIPRARRYQHATNHARAPIFDFPLSKTVHYFPIKSSSAPASPSADRPLPEIYDNVSAFDTVNEVFQELPLYQAPYEPSADPRQNRRVDESSPNYARITNPSYLLESKPLLVSTLNPAKKRKRDGEWGEMLDLLGEEGRDPLLDLLVTGTDLSLSSGLSRTKDTFNKRYNPTPPPNAEARSATMEWTAEEDRQLQILVRQYSYNWDLVAHVFNTATKRTHIKTDERLAWDCFDRYVKNFMDPSGTANSLSHSVTTPQTAGQPLPSPAGGVAQPPKGARRSSTAANQPPNASLQTPAAAATGGMSTAQMRHTLMVEATRKAQMRRAQQQKANLPPAIRKVSLSAHDTHNAPYYPNMSALDLSKLKVERERAHMEEIRKREQAKMYQQAQAAAMAQQQMQQLQAQGQPIPPQLQAQVQRNAMQIPPNARLPPGALPPTLQASQAALLQAQRAGQLPLHLQQQMQQGQPRPMGVQTAPRPPSQQGVPGQPGQITPGGSQQPIPMPMPHSSPPQGGYPGGVHLPMQPRTGSPQNPNIAQMHHASQSPQPSQLQLSPRQQHQLQMQLQAQLQMQQQQQQAQSGVAHIPQLTPAQQQAFLAQLAAQGRAGSPNMSMGMGGLPNGGFQVPQQQQGQQGQVQMSSEQQQQFLAMMRARQTSQSSQASVQ